MRVSLSLISPSSFSFIFSNSWTVNSRLIFGLFLTFWAFSPNLKVDNVSGRCISCGEQVTIRVVFELPPRESRRIRVNLELRYGTCPCPFLSERAFITVPRFVRLRLIFFAYYKTFPSAPVLDIFYDPAKSIKKSLLVFDGPSGRAVCERVSCNIKCDLEECSFILVAAVIRFLWPWAINPLSSALSVTYL